MNHFLSPRTFFTWAWNILPPAGLLLIEVKNFRQQIRRSGRIGNSIQIDHVYMFAPETLGQYLTAAGFETIACDDDEQHSLRKIQRRREAGLPGWQVRALARKTNRKPFIDIDAAIGQGAYSAVAASLRPARIFLHHYLRYRWLSEFIPHS